MDKEIKIKATSFRVPLDLMRRFKVSCAQRDTSQSTVVTEAIRKWLDKSAVAPLLEEERKPNDAVYPVETEHLHRILENGSEDQRGIVRDLLKSTAEKIAAGRKAPVPRARGKS